MPENIDPNFAKLELAREGDLHPDNFPELWNLSAAFIYNFTPRPSNILQPEFVYIPLHVNELNNRDESLAIEVAITEWNMLWEAGQLRQKFFSDVSREKRFPQKLKWLCNLNNLNLYLIPNGRKSKFDAFRPLYHLLPLRTLRKFRLPAFKKGLWPCYMYNHLLDYHITEDFDSRIADAFARHVWPFLNSGSPIRAFSKSDPIILLAHNLNFWLPCAYKLAEKRLSFFPRVDFEDDKQRIDLRKLNKILPKSIKADRPLCGGSIWRGEEEALEATQELVDIADADGKLRGIIDAIKSNRIEDDFSNIWSCAKEDFERKIYHKRNKMRVSFVELDEAKPVHAPTSELHDNLLWEDFLAVLNIKERHIVVCLKNGITKHSEISQMLGYANHSPVSKALKRIREKAKKYLMI